MPLVIKGVLDGAGASEDIFCRDRRGGALVPGTGGIFEVRVGDELVWSRKEKGRLPDIKELKQLVRDMVAPGMDLGHTDR
jgi:predicted Rdx family selenoprotein